MDSYVIRIYRRNANIPGDIAGQIEFVEREEKRSFGSSEELMEMLTRSKKGKAIPATRPGAEQAPQKGKNSG